MFRVYSLGSQNRREKKDLFDASFCPEHHFLGGGGGAAYHIVMGRIKQHFLDQGLTAKDIPLAFACVVRLFFSRFLSFFSSLVLRLERSARSVFN